MRAIDHEAELRLGRTVVRCRHRRRCAVWLDMGGSPIYLILTPLIIALFLTLPIFALCRHFEVPREYTIPATVFLLVAAAIVIYSIYFTASDKISLALHERGFRYKTRLLEFSDIALIRFGKVDSAFVEAFHSFSRLVGTFHRGARIAAAMKEISDRVSLTVTFKDGRTMIMKNALIEYQRPDLEQFFRIIQDQHPALLNNDKVRKEPSPTPAPNQRIIHEPVKRPDLQALTREGTDPSFGNTTARDTRLEFSRGNYRPAKLLLEATNDAELRAFYVRSLQEWSGRPIIFDKWKREEPHDPNAWLASGAHMIYWAWQTHGSDPSAELDQQTVATFQERLRLADSELERAAGLNMEDPTPHTLQLSTCIGLEKSMDKTVEIFDQVVRRCPSHYLAHSYMLTYLCQKWHGSHDEMFEIARVAGEQAPEGSLLHSLIAQAHTERWHYAATVEGDTDGNEYFQQDAVGDAILGAYKRSLGSPQYTPTPLGYFAANYFAFALQGCGQWEEAHQACERIGDCPDLLPWSYLGDATEVYQRIRTELADSCAPAECS